MKLIKTSAIALAMSALLAGPVLAQGTAADPQVRGGAQGKMQKGGAGSGDEEFNAQPGAPGERAGTSTKSKGTVGAGSGAPRAVAAARAGRSRHRQQALLASGVFLRACFATTTPAAAAAGALFASSHHNRASRGRP